MDVSDQVPRVSVLRTSNLSYLIKTHLFFNINSMDGCPRLTVILYLKQLKSLTIKIFVDKLLMSFLTLLLLLTTNFKCTAQSSNRNAKHLEKKNDALFVTHFHRLDSLANSNPFDSSQNCRISIKFMENLTGIIASGEANYFGVMLFSRKDLNSWENWYKFRKVKLKQ